MVDLSGPIRWEWEFEFREADEDRVIAKFTLEFARIKDPEFYEVYKEITKQIQKHSQ